MFPPSRSPALNDPYQNDHNGDDQQDMNKAAHGVSRHHSQEPEQNQNYRDCFQHSFISNKLFIFKRSTIGCVSHQFGFTGIFMSRAARQSRCFRRIGDVLQTDCPENAFGRVGLRGSAHADGDENISLP
jgi:hypothetical protein